MGLLKKLMFYIVNYFICMKCWNRILRIEFRFGPKQRVVKDHPLFVPLEHGRKEVLNYIKYPIFLDPDPPIFIIHSASPTSVNIIWLPVNGTQWRMPGTTFFVNFRRQGRNCCYK